MYIPKFPANIPIQNHNITIDTAPSLEMIINELASDEFLTFYIALKKWRYASQFFQIIEHHTSLKDVTALKLIP